MKLKKFEGQVTVIQGEKDKFGNVNVVKNDLKDAMSRDIKYFEIKDADHSYRNSETKKPIFENEAIKVLSKLN